MPERRWPILEPMDPRLIAYWRERTPAERIAVVDRLWHELRACVEADVRRREPCWDEASVARAVARRMQQPAERRFDA